MLSHKETGQIKMSKQYVDLFNPLIMSLLSGMSLKL